MGTIVPLGHFTQASRKRLGSRIRDLVDRMHQETGHEKSHVIGLEIGRLIHIESELLYTQAEMSEQMKLAPWLHTIGKLAEEQPESFGSVDTRNALRGCVEEYIASLQSVQITA